MRNRERVLNAIIIWATALTFLTATAWTRFSASEMPLRGLKELEDPAVGGPLTLVTLVLAVLLSIPPLWTRERQLVCAGFCLCLFFVVAYAVSSSGALGFVLIAVNLVRETRPSKGDRAPPSEDRAV